MFKACVRQAVWRYRVIEEYLIKEEKAVLLASLLRGVELFLRQNGPEWKPAVQSEQSLTAKWRDSFSRCVDADLLQMLVHPDYENNAAKNHSLPEDKLNSNAATLRRLINRAESLASSSQASMQTQLPFLKASLSPVFDHIELRESHDPAPRRFLLKTLTSTATEFPPPVFPVPGDRLAENEQKHYSAIFLQRLTQFRERIDWDDFDCVYTHLLSLLQTSAWCLPSNSGMSAPDVSLYDHTRVTSAIAACIYKFHFKSNTLNKESIGDLDQTSYILLTGDISGIQDYIFDISTIGAGGVAKRLRARSFFVQLVSDFASLRVISDFGLKIANLLMGSGGNFYILLPNLKDTITKLRNLQQEFDRAMLNEFHGVLAINLAWIEMADGDFASGNYGETLARLRYDLQLSKLQRLGGALRNGEYWDSQSQGEDHPVGAFAGKKFEGSKVCAACNRFPATKYSDPDETEIDVCVQCYSQLRLGRLLTKAKYISLFQDGGGKIKCLGLSATINTKIDTNSDARGRRPFLVISLNDPDLSDVSSLPAVFRYMANHIPRDENEPWDFTRIANHGEIRESNHNLLGVLKADVDYLGQVFQEGLRRDPPDKGLDTASRIAALSRQIDWFFSGWLEWLLSKKYPECYTVYSGGDDLLIIGPRTTILELAREIKQEFTRYTGNPEMTISAGIAVVKPRLPLAHTVKQADAALERAKHSGRNRVCLLDDSITWPEFDALADEINKLLKEKSTSAFLYYLLRCAELWQEYKQNHRLSGLRYHPLLAYYIAHNIDPKKQPVLYDLAMGLLEFPPGDKVEALLSHLRLIAQWVLLERREN